jgi:hypothetical protein
MFDFSIEKEIKRIKNRHFQNKINADAKSIAALGKKLGGLDSLHKDLAASE